MASMCFQQKRDPFPSTPLSDSEDDDLPSVKKIIAGEKSSLFKDRPPWSRFKSPPPPLQRLRAASDNDKPTLTLSDPSSEDAGALVGQSADSPEIAETPKGACNSLYCEEDDHSEGGSGPFHFYRC
jgi:hypothetical protein